MARHIVIKLTKTKDRETNLKAVRNNTLPTGEHTNSNDGLLICNLRSQTDVAHDISQALSEKNFKFYTQQNYP